MNKNKHLKKKLLKIWMHLAGSVCARALWKRLNEGAPIYIHKGAKQRKSRARVIQIFISSQC